MPAVIATGPSDANTTEVVACEGAATNALLEFYEQEPMPIFDDENKENEGNLAKPALTQGQNSEVSTSNNDLVNVLRREQHLAAMELQEALERAKLARKRLELLEKAQSQN